MPGGPICCIAMQLTPPPLPPSNQQASGANVGLTVVMWIVWLGVSLAADFLGFLMFAFADSPGSAGAAKLMIFPAFAWFGFTLVAGAVLLIRRRVWRIVLAFVLAASPPFVIFAGYNLLNGGGNRSGTPDWSASQPPTSAPFIDTPRGGFAPQLKVPEQPDFRKYLPVRPETQPAATTQP